ncbi:MAG: DUF1501 domain-containing protein [Fuerstiella sp.]|nr:DUF1501 domain-containing protein [Fuerstiella sp.]
MRPEQSGVVQHLNRRNALQLGAFGLSALNPCFATAGIKQQTVPPRADNCILLFLNGGPSHLDMWDMKPDGPREVRGEFQPVESSLPGVLLSEHLPRLAQQMHHTTLIRSMNHSVNNSHAAAVYAALTGHDRGELGGGAKPTDRPSPGSVLAWLRPPENHTLPYVALPYKTKEGANGPLQPGFLAGLMGKTYDPFWVLNNPNSNDFHVDNLQLPAGVSSERMKNRSQLLQGLGGGVSIKHEPSVSAIDDFRNQVFELVTSNAAQQAFNLERESADTRARYGRNIYGQSTLLARRLIEAGTRFVTLSWAEHANATWDTHSNNFKNLKNRLLPEFDAACSSLLQDLDDRGLLDRTLVAVLGDFGRSPKVNDRVGRDHWNSCYTVMLAGAGIRKGFVLGASDRYGATPTENPVTPGDVITTIYRLLGVDPTTQIFDSLDRPHEVVPKGHVIQEILA